MRGDNISTVGDNISTLEGIQYIGGITSVHAGITSVQWGDNISTVEGIQYSGGYRQYSGGYLQYSGGYHQYSGGITSVLWRLLSTVKIKI